jgi:uncharacterized protein
VGILTYNRDGKIVQEFRPESEMFSSTTLESLQLLPVTLEHPAELLNANNTSEYQVGTVGDELRRVGDKVSQSIIITRADAIQAIKTRAAIELSLAYTCDIEETPGEWRGHRYDAIQRNVKGNHVAITKNGRAGPECAIRLDNGDDSLKCEVVVPTKEAIKNDEVTVSTAEAEVAALKVEISELRVKLDAAVASRKDSISLVDLEKIISDRIKLIEQAKKISPAVKFDSLTELDIKVQSIQAFDNTYKDIIKDKTPEFIDGVFQTLGRRDSGISNITRVDAPSATFFTRSDQQLQATGPDLKATFEQAIANAGNRKG